MTTATPSRTSTARPPRPRPRLGTYIGLAAVVAITIWAGIGIEFDLRPLWTDLGRGWFIIQEFLAPNWSYIGRTIGPFIETLSIAVIATLVGCAVGLGMSLLASRVTTADPVLYRTAKLFLSVVRSLPDVGYGLLFFALVGAGSLAGILALIMFNIGIIAKLTSETIDAVDRGPLDAADATGASALQRARFAVVPMILPNYLSYCLYVFELNIRASVVIGIVGGGGIGSSISVEFARFNYSNVSAIVVLLIVVVFAIDLLSQSLRRRLT
ncbi:MAG: phosphonate ABC transporter, permease protein PhnE [Actinobacteria bacterium]|nr:phosphonate ABC transporter, permease protein PhnE [Actinomycetota bacterium]MBU1609722.1 phosphonate ABC transporter, permease protein PhnE [Actinomycetota bacterium]MBU2316227.1 phosphonate ABC transporter, permease protein PhnE [Actinomycetota bacterium]MBU2385703.1 phosphonate ABC transporter, permease protein PhnE [Actinomycetota bacterium]